jgi:hypothetical protein
MSTMRDRIWVLITLASAACGSSSPGLMNAGPPPMLSGPLISFDVAAAAAANAALLPAGYTTPQGTVCAMDTSRAFLGELATHGLSDVQVNYEWAPVVPGPTMNRPIIAQPEFYLSGSLLDFERSGADVLFAHPWSFDVNMDFMVDAPFEFLVDNRPNGAYGPMELHTELEEGLFPDGTFMFTPDAGDRALMKGAWILDCGHPVYEAELHPPTFLAVARQMGEATVSLAFVNPFRASQLYGPPELVDDFANTARFIDQRVLPFPAHFESEILAAATTPTKMNLEAHVLLEPTHFDTISWFVCAPSPRPSGSSLHYSYRFVSRTGVTVTPVQRGDSCLEFTATMTAAYQPAALARMDTPWQWADLSAAASGQAGTMIDVRQKIIDTLNGLGFTNDIPALHVDHPPIIDSYAPLAPHADAALDTPTLLKPMADDQPFPFYGRVRVYWQ